MLICPKCGKEFKRIYNWKRHVRDCFPRLTPQELNKLYKELGLRKITDYYEDYEKPIAPMRGVRR